MLLLESACTGLLAPTPSSEVAGWKLPGVPQAAGLSHPSDSCSLYQGSGSSPSCPGPATWPGGSRCHTQGEAKVHTRLLSPEDACHHPRKNVSSPGLQSQPFRPWSHPWTRWQPQSCQGEAAFPQDCDSSPQNLAPPWPEQWPPPCKGETKLPRVSGSSPSDPNVAEAPISREEPGWPWALALALQCQHYSPPATSDHREMQSMLSASPVPSTKALGTNCIRWEHVST